MTSHYFVTAAVAALALTGCGTAEDTTEAAPTETPVAETTTATEAPAAATPQSFVDAAAASDMFETESARVAQEKSQTPAVGDFAQMMIDDHSTSTESLRQAAGQVEGVTVSPKMTPDQQQKLTALRDAPADQFDALYKQQQVAAHEQALQLMQNYAEAGQSEPLTGFASTTAPVIERHLGMARELP